VWLRIPPRLLLFVQLERPVGINRHACFRARSASPAVRAMQEALMLIRCLGDHKSRGAFIRPSAPLVAQPLLGAQNQEAHVIGEPLAPELSQVALERS
jgi:hypothetical protein